MRLHVSTVANPPNPKPPEDEAAPSSLVIVQAMGSTSPASNNDHRAQSVPSTCGLVGSLFPSSCRGRAEAFARRLHRRLTSLSSTEDDTVPEVNPNETSWLQSNHKTPTVHDSQPRHSPESDLYYDFDLSPENDPGSPEEVVTAAELADLLVNHKDVLKYTKHHDNSPSQEVNHENESGYVFSSPLSGTSPEDSEAYYDPESSEADKTKTDDYFDPVTTSGSSEAINCVGSRHSGRRRGVLNGESSEENTEKQEVDSKTPKINKFGNFETSDESSSSDHQNPQQNGRNVSSGGAENGGKFESTDKIGRIEKLKNLKINNSSEDSLNDVASSLETTSPSHESLWSTFDESTTSLQDDVSSIAALPPQPRFSKSHSDSELIPRITRIPTVESQHLDEVDFTNSSSEASRNQKFGLCNGEVEKSPATNGESRKSQASHADEEIPLESSKNSLENPPNTETSTENGQNSGAENRYFSKNPRTSEDSSTYNSTWDLPGALEVECPLQKSSEPPPEPEKLQIAEVNLKIGDNGEETSVEGVSRLLKQMGESIESQKDETEETGTNEEDDEEEEERPRRLRRCSSLKTGKTPPGTPGRKKIVRFADVLGLDLADVRTFLDEVPKVPNSAYSDLIYDDIFSKDSSPSSYGSSPTSTTAILPALGNIVKPDRMLVPMFQQPGGRPDFLDLVRDRQVCLENVVVQDPITLCLQGTVRVRNLDFHKSVHIRYSRDSWKTFSDLQALYVDGSCDGFCDKFSFVLYCHTLKVGQKLEMAIRFQCKGTQFWDNNGGSNYCFQCLPMSMGAGYAPITVAGGGAGHHDWQPTFY